MYDIYAFLTFSDILLPPELLKRNETKVKTMAVFEKQA